jgi:hypothetical protein
VSPASRRVPAGRRADPRPDPHCRTIASLSDLIGRRKAGEVIDETIYAKKPIELSLYRNQISHMFLSESACALPDVPPPPFPFAPLSVSRTS